MAVKETASPAIEPLTLSEAKDHLRVVGDDENRYIYGLIRAARMNIENSTGRALISRTFLQTWDTFPRCRALKLERAPLVSVSSVTYIDANGDTQTLSASQYVVDSNSTPGRITLKAGYSWPITWRDGAAVSVAYTAGYGSTRESIPNDLIQAMFFLVGHLYAHREPIIIGASVADLPMSIEYLAAPYRVYL